MANLKNFRHFYLTFANQEKGYALRSELSWSHYRLIMRVDDNPTLGIILCADKDEKVQIIDVGGSRTAYSCALVPITVRRAS